MYDQMIQCGCLLKSEHLSSFVSTCVGFLSLPFFMRIFFPSLLSMTSHHAMDDSIPFTLPLGPNGVVVVYESLLSLEFGFRWAPCIWNNNCSMTLEYCFRQYWFKTCGKMLIHFGSYMVALTKSKVCLRCTWICLHHCRQTNPSQQLLKTMVCIELTP